MTGWLSWLTRSISRKIGVLLVLFSFGAFAGMAVFSDLLAQTQTAPQILNFAGRQRVLSQELMVFAVMVSEGQKEDRARLSGLVARFDGRLRALKAGGQDEGVVVPAVPPEVRGDFEAVEGVWTSLKTELKTIAARPVRDVRFREALAAARIGVPRLTEASDRAVNAYVGHFARLRRRALRVFQGVAFLDLFLLAVGFWFLRFRVVRPLLELQETTRRMSGGDLSIRAPVFGRDELSLLAGSFNEMAAELEKSTAQMRDILDNSAAVIFLKDVEGRYLFANRRHAELFHVQAAQLHGKTDYDIFPKDVADSFRSNEREILATGETRTLEASIPQDDGIHHYITTKFVLRDAAGKPYAVCGIATDVTELKRAEAELSRLTVAVEQMADPVLITDSDGIIQYVNPAFERVTGYSRNEVRGKKPSILKSGQQTPEFYETLWNTISNGSPWKGRLTNKTKNGELLVFEQAISPVRAPSGRVSHYVSVARDLTKELVVERRLQESARLDAIGRLAGGVAHDFNNVLFSILGCAQLAIQAAGISEATRSDLQEIIDAANRGSALTRQLLAFGRKQSLAPIALDLGPQVNGMVRMLARLLGANVKLSVQAQPGLGKVKADPVQIEQVVMNLVLNARDAMAAGGMISIELNDAELDAAYAWRHPGAAPGRYALISVTDTGGGMDEETRARIFEPFFTTKEPGQGTGLGLATVYGIVTQSGGHVTVHSELGRGTTFKVYLPRAEATA